MELRAARATQTIPVGGGWAGVQQRGVHVDHVRLFHGLAVSPKVPVSLLYTLSTTSPRLGCRIGSRSPGATCRSTFSASNSGDSLRHNTSASSAQSLSPPRLVNAGLRQCPCIRKGPLCRSSGIGSTRTRKSARKSVSPSSWCRALPSALYSTT